MTPFSTLPNLSRSCLLSSGLSGILLGLTRLQRQCSGNCAILVWTCKSAELVTYFTHHSPLTAQSRRLQQPRKPRAFASALVYDRAQKAMKLPSALASFQVCPLRYRRQCTTAPFAKKTSPRACGSLSASAWVVWESAEGIKPPSASAPSHAGFPPLPQPLHVFALHGFAKGRYTIKHSPFAGCWCMGSLDVPWPHTIPAMFCRLRRLLCVAALNITASYAKHMCRENARPSGSHKRPLCLAPFG